MYMRRKNEILWYVILYGYCLQSVLPYLSHYRYFILQINFIFEVKIKEERKKKENMKENAMNTCLL